MKIAHIIEDFSIHSGGLRTVVQELNGRLNNVEGVESFVISSRKESEDDIFLVETNKPWLFSKDWEKLFNSIKKDRGIDVIHIHGVWMFPQYCAAKFAIKNKIPFILTPHGMYEPWLWEKGRLKKKIYFNSFANSVFSKASKIHGITSDEIKNLASIFPSSNFVELPNVIDHNKFSLQEDFFVEKKEKYFFYLGRLDAKKGIDMLIKSFSRLKNDDFKLKIAGPFNAYKIYLEKLVKELKIEDKVEFLGLVTGEEKERLYKQAFVFVAPSYSEVVGMVNLEAAICKTPVITTFQTGLDLKWNDNGGILINPNESELTQALIKVANWTFEERKLKGEHLSDFVKLKYSWQKRIKDWELLYKSLVQ
ncbi:glycosyltransferase [Aestuariibaculum sp. YM273]|uniref:glycosyltransferase n=1 Tax=Aestuariibaculum sp. YM273 TaxID=3070659 RepID=UPI0027DBE4F4|nr:glycosyltransferase [Aestuariibaculum sp. YM273]WMI66627.1 glycosyltransferase [Aestuariibaculum sp. YM273]